MLRRENVFIRNGWLVFFNQSWMPCPNCHNHFEVQKRRSPSFFVFIFGSKVVSRLACLTWHTYVHYPIVDKNKPAKVPHLKAVATPARGVSVGYAYLQREGYGWRRYHYVSYHIYLMYFSYTLKIVVAFIHISPFGVYEKNPSDTGKKADQNPSTAENDCMFEKCNNKNECFIAGRSMVCRRSGLKYFCT